MKIVINAASAKMGGAVSYLTNLLRYLPPPESGYRFFVFLPGETATLLPDVRENINLCALPSNGADGWKRLWWEQVTLRRFLVREKVDALYSTANFAMFRCPVKQILLVRNALYFSKMVQQMFLGKHRLRFRLAFALRRWMILQSVRSADVLMTPTQAMLDDLAKFVKLDRRKTLVNYYGADRQDSVDEGSSVQSHLIVDDTPSVLHPSSPRPSPPSPPWGRGWTAAGAFSSRAGPGEGVARNPAPAAATEPGVVRLTYVSLYSEHKNLSTLLKAMPLLNRNGAGKFLLSTTVDPAWKGAAWTVTYKDDLALARQPDVAPWVEFSGPLSRRQAQQLYRAADVFVFPSFCESFGHPMVEAMVHGLPIVAADTPVNREMCAAAALYFSPLDPHDLAEKVDLLGRDPALREKLGAIGRESVATHFGWKGHVLRLLEAASLACPKTACEIAQLPKRSTR